MATTPGDAMAMTTSDQVGTTPGDAMTMTTSGPVGTTTDDTVITIPENMLATMPDDVLAIELDDTLATETDDTPAIEPDDTMDGPHNGRFGTAYDEMQGLVPVTTNCRYFDNLSDTAKIAVVASVEFYLKSIQESMPAFYLPKEVVDSMGAAKLARIAHNYGNHIRTDVSIVYDPAFDLFKIAPPEYLASDATLIYCDTVIYQGGNFMPLRKWELMIPNSPDCASNFDHSPRVEVGPGNKKITKPPNSFILFRRDYRHLVQKRYPQATIGQISTITAKMWLEADRDVKLNYHHAALKLRAQHNKDYPNWKCQPRKSSDIKKRAVNKNFTSAGLPVLVSMANSTASPTETGH